MNERLDRILAAIAADHALRRELEARAAALAPVIEGVAGMSALAWTACARVLPEGLAQSLAAFRKEDGA